MVGDTVGDRAVAVRGGGDQTRTVQRRARGGHRRGLRPVDVVTGQIRFRVRSPGQLHLPIPTRRRQPRRRRRRHRFHRAEVLAVQVAVDRLTLRRSERPVVHQHRGDVPIHVAASVDLLTEDDAVQHGVVGAALRADRLFVLVVGGGAVAQHCRLDQPPGTYPDRTGHHVVGGSPALQHEPTVRRPSSQAECLIRGTVSEHRARRRGCGGVVDHHEHRPVGVARGEPCQRARPLQQVARTVEADRRLPGRRRDRTDRRIARRGQIIPLPRPVQPTHHKRTRSGNAAVSFEAHHGGGRQRSGTTRRRRRSRRGRQRAREGSSEHEQHEQGACGGGFPHLV